MSFEHGVSVTRGVSVYSVQMDMNKKPILVLSWLEIEHKELTSVNPLKYKFPVLPKLLKNATSY